MLTGILLLALALGACYLVKKFDQKPTAQRRAEEESSRKASAAYGQQVRNQMLSYQMSPEERAREARRRGL